MPEDSRVLVHLLAAGLLLAPALPAVAQQAYPVKPVRFIVPFPPGGSADPMARMAAQKLSDRWGQPVVVDNRGGGNTIIGSEAMVKSPADGYTILLVGTTHVANPSLLAHLPYDTLRDFDAVATIARSRFLLAVNAGVPAATLQELIALARAKEGQFSYASSGEGSGPHLSAVLFEMMTGAKLQHIPYKGGAQSVTDLVSGRVQMIFANPGNVAVHVKSGKLKALAVTGAARPPGLPQVPTFAEAGLPGYDMSGWYGILAPARTPRDIVEKISADMAVILAMPDISDRLVSQGAEPFISTPDQFAGMIRSEVARYAKIVKAASIKVE